MRKFQSQNNGKVKFRVGWASIKYDATRVDCDFPDDIDLTLDNNDPSVSLTNFTYETLKSCYPNSTTSWVWCTTPKKTLDPNVISGGNVDGYDLRVRAWPRMKFSSVDPFWICQ